MQRANQVKTMGLLRLQREQLTHVETGSGRLDRAERAPIVLRRVGLQVIRFQVARSTPHPKQDDRGIRRPGFRAACSEKLRQAQPAQCQGSYTQKITPGYGAATGMRFPHGSSLSGTLLVVPR